MKTKTNNNSPKSTSDEKEIAFVTKIIINGQILEKEYHPTSVGKTSEQKDESKNK